MATTPEADYKRMYAILCGAISDALDVLHGDTGAKEATCILETALLKAEELYIGEHT